MVPLNPGPAKLTLIQIKWRGYWLETDIDRGRVQAGPVSRRVLVKPLI
jgi:hypothetical protein